MNNPYVYDLTLGSKYDGEQKKYVHFLSFVIADIDAEKDEPIYSEQVSLVTDPAVQASQFVNAMRELADRVEEISAADIPPVTEANSNEVG
jgi:hypothetical protein